MSWQGPSAPRVDGIATKSLVVASCASKLSSTAARTLCLVSLSIISACSGVRFQNRVRLHTVPTKLRALWRHGWPSTATSCILVIGALIVAVGALSYNLYQTNNEPEGLQINVGPNGLKIQSK